MTMKAGTVLNGPDGMGYTVTRDLNAVAGTASDTSIFDYRILKA